MVVLVHGRTYLLGGEFVAAAGGRNMISGASWRMGWPRSVAGLPPCILGGLSLGSSSPLPLASAAPRFQTFSNSLSCARIAEICRELTPSFRRFRTSSEVREYSRGCALIAAITWSSAAPDFTSFTISARSGDIRSVLTGGGGSAKSCAGARGPYASAQSSAAHPKRSRFILYE